MQAQAQARQRATKPTAPTPLFGRVTGATPGRIRLQAVRESGRVVDFSWAFVCSAAAGLLNCDPQTLLGKRLNSMAGGPLGHPALIDRYRRVLEHGNQQSFEQVHVVNGQQDLIIHRVARLGDGVEVSLTNLSAARRAHRAVHGPTRQHSVSSDPFA